MNSPTNSPKDYLTDRVKEKMQIIKKGVRIDLDNLIENLEGYNEANNKMSYEDVLFTQINSYFQAVLVKVEAFLTETIQQSMEVGEKKQLERIISKLIHLKNNCEEGLDGIEMAIDEVNKLSPKL